MRKQQFITIWILLLSVAITHSQSAGSLDPSFRGAGIDTVGNGWANDLIIAPDGKIIVAAGAYIPNSTKQQFALFRFHSNGEIDSTFGTNGIAVTYDTNYLNEESVANSVALQSDGKIVAAGGALRNNFFSLMIVRYNTDGVVDTTFGDKGKIIFSPWGYASDIIVQQDDKILVAGTVAVNIDGSIGERYYMNRYNIDGDLDSTFGFEININDSIYKGVVIDTISNDFYNSQVRSILISDDKIILAGRASPNQITPFGLFLVCFDENGHFFSSFGNNGVVNSQIGSADVIFKSAVISSDNKIVVGGSVKVSGLYNFCVVRYNIDGTIDSTFSGDGIARIQFGGKNCYAESIVMQSDGKIVAGGLNFTNSVPSNIVFALARLNVDGTLDNSFSDDGKQTSQFGDSIYIDQTISALAIDADGKILAVGVNKLYSPLKVILARFISGAVGVRDVDFQSSKIELYPNPSNGVINLHFGMQLHNACIQLISTQGEVVIRKNAISGNKFSMDISQYSNGIYFLEVRERDKIARAKIIKN